MENGHKHEKMLKSFNYHGAKVDVVQWDESIWCGKVGYADDNIDEPNVEQIMNDFMATYIPTVIPNNREAYWIQFYKTKEFGLNSTKGNS